MKVICIVKQVPAIGAIEFDEETKTLKREGVPLELNAFDRSVDNLMASLRKKLSYGDANGARIQSARGRGYAYQSALAGGATTPTHPPHEEW